MKTRQDDIPIHKLSGKPALDGRGRVLRKPHFYTAEEFDAALATHDRIMRGIIESEREQALARIEDLKAQHATKLVEREMEFVTAMNNSSADWQRILNTVKMPVMVTERITLRPHIRYRRRLRWLARRLIRISVE